MKHACLVITLALLAGCGSPPPQRGVPEELLNPAVTPENVQQTICVPAYAASITPSEASMLPLMREMTQRTGTDPELAGSFVLDHRLPVVLGGHPTNRANLQMIEPTGTFGSRRKQALERRLMLMVCEGKIGLREAQAAMVPDWQAAYARYVEGRTP